MTFILRHETQENAKSMITHSGTVLNYNYGTSGAMDDLAARPVSLAIGATTHASYTSHRQ